MRILMFYHALVSDWNHGNAHFLRGVATELLARGHNVCVFEPRNSWSVENLIAEYGETPMQKFRATYPGLDSVRHPCARRVDELRNLQAGKNGRKERTL